MKNKRLIYTILFMIMINHINSQTSFNKDLKIMNYISNAGRVLTIGDTIICIGFGEDVNPWESYKHYMAKFDMEGNLLNIFRDTIGSYDYQETNTAYVIDNKKIITVVDVYIFKSPGVIDWWGGSILIIDVGTNKIERRIKFTTPQGDKKWQLIDGFTKIDSVTYAVVSNIDEIYGNYLDTQVSIINIGTGRVKYIQYGRKKVDDSPFTIIWTGEKLLVGSYYAYPDFDPNNPWQKRTYHTLIYEVDTSGTVEEAYVSDTMRSAALEMMMDQEGNYVFLSSYVKYHYDEWKERYYKRRHYSINKLDREYNLIWERPCGLKYDFTGYNGKAGKVLSSIEGDGYIVAMAQANYPWDITREEKEAMRERGMSPMMVGVLSKFSKGGDEIWTRSYSVVSDTSIGHIEHRIKDVTYGPDGGYVVFGEIGYNGRKGIDTVANYHAWLFKVDDYGCLVSGCQLSDSVKVKDTEKDIKIQLYPNPVTDRLYIYQRQGGDTQYSVTDISGRKIQRWRGKLSEHTYILDVSIYKPGIYILTVKKAGQVLSRKFVVER